MKSNDLKRPARSRNFLARHPLMKKGGVHQKSKKAERKAAKQALLTGGRNGEEFTGKRKWVDTSLFASEFIAEYSEQGWL